VLISPPPERDAAVLVVGGLRDTKSRSKAMSRIWLALAAALTLALGACDQQQAEQSGEPAAPATQQQSAVPSDSSGGDQPTVPQGTE